MSFDFFVSEDNLWFFGQTQYIPTSRTFNLIKLFWRPVNFQQTVQTKVLRQPFLLYIIVYHLDTRNAPLSIFPKIKIHLVEGKYLFC